MNGAEYQAQQGTLSTQIDNQKKIIEVAAKNVAVKRHAMFIAQAPKGTPIADIVKAWAANPATNWVETYADAMAAGDDACLWQIELQAPQTALVQLASLINQTRTARAAVAQNGLNVAMQSWKNAKSGLNDLEQKSDALRVQFGVQMSNEAGPLAAAQGGAAYFKLG